jgi:hypothetical protein
LAQPDGPEALPFLIPVQGASHAEPVQALRGSTEPEPVLVRVPTAVRALQELDASRLAYTALSEERFRAAMKLPVSIRALPGPPSSRVFHFAAQHASNLLPARIQLNASHAVLRE